MPNNGSPVTLLKFQVIPNLMLLISSGSKEEARYAYLREAKTSHSQRMWVQIRSFPPHILHKGLSSSPAGEDVSSVCYLQYVGQLQRWTESY